MTENQVILRFESFQSFLDICSDRVSEEGLFLETEDVSPVGSTVEFDLGIDSDFPILRGTGEVVWVADQAAEGAATPGMALRYSHTDEATATLARKIANRQRQATGSAFSLAELVERAAAAVPMDLVPDPVEPEIPMEAEPNATEAVLEPAAVEDSPEASGAAFATQNIESFLVDPEDSKTELPVAEKSDESLSMLDEEEIAVASEVVEEVGEPSVVEIVDDAPEVLGVSNDVDGVGDVDVVDDVEDVRAAAAAAAAEAVEAIEAQEAVEVEEAVEPPKESAGDVLTDALEDPELSDLPTDDLSELTSTTVLPPGVEEAMSALDQKPAGSGRSGLFAVLGLVAVIAGVGYWQRDNLADLIGGRAESVEARGAAPASPEASEAPEAVDVPEAESPEISETETVEEPDAPVSLESDRQPEAVVEAPAPSVISGTVTRVEKITWATDPGSTLLSIEGNGAFADGSFRIERLSDPARILIRVFGVSRPLAEPTFVLATDEVIGIRTGLHSTDQSNALHIVVDLASPASEVSERSTDGATLQVRISSTAVSP